MFTDEQLGVFIAAEPLDQWSAPVYMRGRFIPTRSPFELSDGDWAVLRNQIDGYGATRAEMNTMINELLDDMLAVIFGRPDGGKAYVGRASEDPGRVYPPAFTDLSAAIQRDDEARLTRAEKHTIVMGYLSIRASMLGDREAAMRAASHKLVRDPAEVREAREAQRTAATQANVRPPLPPGRVIGAAPTPAKEEGA